MPYIKGADRNQITLMPDCMEDYISAENPVRVIDAFVEQLNIAPLGFKTEPAVEGRPGYDPRDMIKLYIYGYLNKIRSSRRLQTEAGRNVELMWLLGKLVPDFRCIADFRKDNANAIKGVFREFVKLCNKADLLSKEAVVIDGSKFRAVNSDNNCYVKSNVEKLIAQADDKIAKYMAELDAADKTERRSGELTSENIGEVLNYLAKRKIQLENALSELNENGLNHVCTTDRESRLMKTRDGCKPSFNVQTAVEPNNHIIVNFDVTSDCADWGLLESGISGAKDVLGVETLEGIADKGYGNDEEILKCLLNGDTPTIYLNKNQNCRTFKFAKMDDEITSEMLVSNDYETLKKCIATGVLPDILKRSDVTFEIVPTATPQQFLDKETGEIVSYEQVKAKGGTEREKLKLRLETPVQSYFERNLTSDTVICPMGQTLFYAGIGWPNGKANSGKRRYHRASVCAKCRNKCTVGKQRIVSFKADETRKYTDFYDKCGTGRITRRKERRFIPIDVPKHEVVVMKYYPNQRKLRIRNQIVEHPYGTVKRWNDGYYLLVKGRVKAAAELALSFLGYNFKRVLNLLGTKKMLEMITA
ncbi:DDE transposase [Lacrimispora amygdalina]|uniref:DDE transposase n=1 Tax=Lacrimispora amygdalina TaxID=253257 RepID=A0ABQ5M4R1_9FIRM